MAEVIDVHVHFGGPGRDGRPVRGCFWSEKFTHSGAYWAFRMVTKTVGEHIDFEVARDTMLATIGGATKVDRCVLLAMDQVYDPDGRTDLARWTNLYVDNATVAEIAASHPKVLFGASVHPYRPDWRDALDSCVESGAALCKWIPSAQCIDPGSPACRPFYDALAARGLPLLCHAGPEQAIPTHDKRFNHFNNAKFLVPALERGVTVIFGHCSLPFEPTPLAWDDVYQDFVAVMKQAEAHGWKAYADVSALCLLRGSYVHHLLDEIGAGRLLFGSDYPVPMMGFPHKTDGTVRGWLHHLWERVAAENPLDKNHIMLRDMGFPPEVFTRAGSLLRL